MSIYGIIGIIIGIMINHIIIKPIERRMIRKEIEASDIIPKN